MKYFIRINESEFPPFTLDELKEFSKSNNLENAEYWHQGMSSWERIKGSALQKSLKVKNNRVLWKILGVLFSLLLIFPIMIYIFMTILETSDNSNVYQSEVESSNTQVVVDVPTVDIYDDEEIIEYNNLNNDYKTNTESNNSIDLKSDYLIDESFLLENEKRETKKFLYIVFDVKVPTKMEYIEGTYDALTGTRIEGISFPKYEERQLFSDVIEVDEYSEDLKNRFFDEFEKQNINPYGLPTIHGSNGGQVYKYYTEVLNRNIYVFDSYSEASIDRRNKLDKY